MGAIVRGGNILERMSKVNHVLLDKTGTLTRKTNYRFHPIAKGRQRKSSLALAGGLKRSSHPYAAAVLEYLKVNQLNHLLWQVLLILKQRQRICQRQKGIICPS